MDILKVKALFDACYQAKRVRDLLPELPDGVSASHLHVIDTIFQLHQEREGVTISAVSERLGVPKPGVTKVLKQLEAEGIVLKNTSKQDGRVVYVDLTSNGLALHQVFIQDYFTNLAKRLEGISEDDIDTVVKTMGQLYRIMVDKGV